MANTSNLHDMTLVDLKELRQAVDEEIKKRATKEKVEAQRQIVEIAKSHNINLADLVGREKVYKNPSNPWETWSGKGRKPKWVTEALAAGKTLDDLAT